MLAAEHDEHILEPGSAHLPDGVPDERLAAKRQEELLRSHARRSARGENHPAHQEKCLKGTREGTRMSTTIAISVVESAPFLG
jgi:hypothetical protein